jgi:hypothetical protein
MEILPSVIFAAIAAFMTLRGNRKLALTSWLIALLCMMGAMEFHMDSVMKISL